MTRPPGPGPGRQPTRATAAPNGPDDLRSTGFRGMLRAGLAIVGPDRGLLVALCGTAIVVSVLEVVVLFIVARLALSLTSSDGTIEIDIIGSLTPGEALALAAVMLVVLISLSAPVALLSGRISARALRRIRRRVVDAYLSASWAERANDPEGHLQELAGVYAQYSERLVMQLNSIMLALTGTAALAIGAFVISPVVASLAAVGVAVLAVLLLPLSRGSQRSVQAYQTSNKALSSDMAQTARVAAEIVVFDVPHEVADSMQPSVDATASAVRRARFGQRIIPLLYIDGALAMILSLLAVLHLSDSDSIAAVGPVVLLLVRGLGYLKQLQTAIQSGREFTPYAHGLLAEIDRLEGAPQTRGRRPLDRIEQLSLSSVSFAYDAAEPVFTGVDLTIERGTAVGIVGPSGGGKSTLSHLLLRLRDPTTGTVQVNGVDVGEIAPDAWARLVAFVPQDNDLIRATVAENIHFYRPGIDQAAVEAAARAAHLHDEVMALPDGYRTRIGPGERDLSGGQRQRLGLARALVCEPELLVLDEPTSALDHRSEQAIRQTLRELHGHTTIVVIAHRPATLEICDRILKVADGRIVEADSAEIPPEELAASPTSPIEQVQGSTVPHAGPPSAP